jgi:hypothetical protein
VAFQHLSQAKHSDKLGTNNQKHQSTDKETDRIHQNAKKNRLLHGDDPVIVLSAEYIPNPYGKYQESSNNYYLLNTTLPN